jgi:hypothetical protein
MSNHAFQPPTRRVWSLSDNAIDWIGVFVLIALSFYLTEHYGWSHKWRVGIVLMGLPSLLGVVFCRRIWLRRSLWIAIAAYLPLQIIAILLVFGILLAPFREVSSFFWYPFFVFYGAITVGLIAGLERKLHRRQQTHKTWHGI